MDGIISECRIIGGSIYCGNAGGFTAYAGNGYLKDCYIDGLQFNNTGHKAGLWYVDGATTNCYIENCYFNGDLKTGGTKHPLIRKYGTSVAPVTNSYYNANLTDLYTTEYGTALTDAQFADKSNFVGWDFENTWIIKNGKPELRCFLSATEIAELEALPENQ